MEEDIDNSNTDTIPIPLLDVETKTVPVFCPWCEEISGVAKTDVVRFAKISPMYKACRKCVDFINEWKSFFRQEEFERDVMSVSLFFRAGGLGNILLR